ncbi:hypothetical protein [Methylobacterium oxalidis]|uniref:hypothetical protein n=1 Tax=Methylobacterium oxalidis TaxID=944322 RepID=UPI003315FB2B
MPRKMATPLLLALFLTSPAIAQSGTTYWGEPALLPHGNYCGVGNNAPLSSIDALDAACARHDACTLAGGLPSRARSLRL